jgi:hypothetical protein
MATENTRERIARAIMAGLDEMGEPYNPDAIHVSANHVVAMLVGDLTGLDVKLRHHPSIISPGLVTLTGEEGDSASFLLG